MFGLITRYQQQRINNLDKSKVDISLCEKGHEAITDDLARAASLFQSIDDKLRSQSEILGNHTTTLAVIDEKLTQITKERQ